MISLSVILTILKNKYVQIGIVVTGTILLSYAFVTSEIKHIKKEQQMNDKIAQEEVLNKELIAQAEKDKIIIENYQTQLTSIQNQTDTVKQNVQTIIKANPLWANTPLPSGLAEQLGE